MFSIFIAYREIDATIVQQFITQLASESFLFVPINVLVARRNGELMKKINFIATKNKLHKNSQINSTHGELKIK
jgi:hypothetical protein